MGGGRATGAGGKKSPFPDASPPAQPAPSQPAPVQPTPAEPVQAASQPGPASPAEAPPSAASSGFAQETPPPPATQPDVAAQSPATSIDFIKAFAAGAGIPENVLADRDQEEFARELGTILQGITGDLMGLLQARSQVKAMTRNANRTLISRSGNNALKFSPTPQMALQTMLSQSAEANGYLPIDKAMRNAFKDIQKHHVWTYAAMQKAAARFDETLSPKAIEREGQGAKSTFGNQKAKKNWDRLQERWTSLSGAYDDGLVGVFTQYFTESYEELTGEDPEMGSGAGNSGRID
ncbi:type VI secretion system-associated FHA domain protein TagH [Roseibium salinum]|nr:type VI secretion system-associated FHA domain protein TagH [Roseibium salinum]